MFFWVVAQLTPGGTWHNLPRRWGKLCHLTWIFKKPTIFFWYDQQSWNSVHMWTTSWSMRHTKLLQRIDHTFNARCFFPKSGTTYPCLPYPFYTWVRRGNSGRDLPKVSRHSGIRTRDLILTAGQRPEPLHHHYGSAYRPTFSIQKYSNKGRGGAGFRHGITNWFISMIFTKISLKVFFLSRSKDH